MNNQQDMTILLGDTLVNMRVAVLLETPSGFVFEKAKDGYVFLLGGRVKLHETTQEAVVREIFEELKLENINAKMIAVIENFFSTADGKHVHEMNFVYKAQLEQSIDICIGSSDNNHQSYCYITADECADYDVRPHVMKELLTIKKPFVHLIHRQ